MAEGHIHDISRDVKKYLYVFLALAILTAVTVGVSRVDLGITGGIVVALIVAAVKGSLVALYFMHLNHEKKSIYQLLGLTVVCFLILVFIALGATRNKHPYYNDEDERRFQDTEIENQNSEKTLNSGKESVAASTGIFSYFFGNKYM